MESLDRFRELPEEGEFEYVPQEETKPSSTWGLLTAVVLVLTLLVLCCYLAIFINPQFMFNPLKPPTVIVLVTPTKSGPTDTPFPTYPPTWTPTATPSPTGTPTITPTPSNTPPATSTPLPTNTPRPPPPYYLDGQPARMAQTLYPGTEAGEWWLGFAGEVTDPNGAAITTVQIKTWDGEGWESFQVPGARTDVVSNYRVNFGGSTAWWEQWVPVNCTLTKTFYLQVIQNGVGLSPVVKIEHAGDCSQNLILVNFKRRY
jgi:hypothetical protein